MSVSLPILADIDACFATLQCAGLVGIGWRAQLSMPSRGRGRGRAGMPFQQMTCTRGSWTQRCAFEQVQRGSFAPPRSFKPLRMRERACLETDHCSVRTRWCHLGWRDQNMNPPPQSSHPSNRPRRGST
jgi:hypothetical protein